MKNAAASAARQRRALNRAIGTSQAAFATMLAIPYTAAMPIARAFGGSPAKAPNAEARLTPASTAMHATAGTRNVHEGRCHETAASAAAHTMMKNDVTTENSTLLMIRNALWAVDIADE